ncbi:E3 ubiquitin-protein ligase highwire-like [Culicoides brevitarsis]|uniref:E3 ubiquitin-protein ligase highwire-like n=1 Tax=Culicoides brevitarsis TaxID=469753 RepID=UPI00307C0A7F
MTLEIENYGKYFQDLFIREFESRSCNNDGNNDPNQKSNKRKSEHGNDSDADISLLAGALPELIPNASQFAIYNAVRQLVLEIKNKKYAIKSIHNKTKKLDSDNAESKTCSLSDRNLEENEAAEGNVEGKEISSSTKLPLIVGAGIRSLFDIITETKTDHPTLCQKALTAIFNIIQGQNPESFKSEPNDIFLALFDLLLELATATEAPASVTEQSEYIPLSDIACSTLLALCVAKGDTGKLLKAVTSTIITRKLSLHQRIHLPQILIKLQRSVQAVILGKLTKPNFFTSGIPNDALVDEFDIEEFNLDSQVITSQPCIASDGKFLYILAGKVLLKVGTGFNGTTKGHVYFLNREFSKDKCGWIGFCNGTLYYKRSSKRNNEFVLIVDTNSLTVNKAVQISLTHRKENCLLFSDGESVNSISSTSDDTLTVKQIYSTSCFTFDLNLRLTKKGFRTLGYANFEEELLTETQVQEIQASYNQFVPTAPNDVDIAGILCGKEFGIAQSTDGKTFYYGKACSLGLKSVGRNPYLKLNELIISKISKTVQIALGHEGLHALFLNEDGNVYFAGCARRGEDGETSKNRRQIKSVKPKKIAKLDGQTIVDISCNNGTSCFVTKTGKLIMFGKDTSYCDSFGFISDLDDQHITKTSLGKAHCVALNIRGEVFTFGLNNKSQCGRVFATKNNETSDEDFDSKRKKYHEAISEAGDVDGQGQIVKGTEAKALPSSNYQQPSSCVHSSPNCYSCSIAKEKRNDKDASQCSDADRDAPRIVSLPPAKLILPTNNPVVQVSCGLHHTVLLTLTGEVFTFGSNAYGQLGTGDLQPVQTPVQVVRFKGKAIQVAAGSNHTVILTASGNVFTFGKYHKGQLGRFPKEMFLNSHDAAQTGQLFSQNIVLTGQKFFWNCHPAEVRGIGPDHGKKASWIGASGDQTFIKMDESLVNAAMLSKFNVAADKNTILLIPNNPEAIKCIAINRKDGSCRAHSNDQFHFTNTEIERQHEGSAFEPGTSSSRYSDSSSDSKTGTSPGRAYTEIGRYLDQSRTIPTMAFTIDNYYDVLYAFNFATKKVMCFNIILAGIPSNSENISQFKSLFVPDIALTTKHDLSVTRYNSALNILACLDILSSAQGSIPSCFESESKDTKDASQSDNDEYNTICRFENFGGGWGYSGNSVEAVRFMCDTDILVAGFGMFGGRGEYTCKIKLYDLGIDGGGGFEKDGVLISETDDISYECAARNKQNIMLSKPVPIFAGKWYLVTARISGPSSDCGSSGQTTITTEDQVMFTFKPSKKSNNGTDVHSGQIPSILYRVVTQENKQQPSKNSDPVCKISKNFSNTLSAECFESLICLLKWSWNSLKITINETAETKKFRINRVSTNILTYLCKVCLRLLRKYTNEIYPNHGFNNDETSQIKPGKFGDAAPTTSKEGKIWPGRVLKPKITSALSEMSLMETTTPVSGKKNNSENIMIAECIGDVRALLIHILCDELQFCNTNLSTEIMQIMEECDVTFIQCFNAFYPTQLLKWNCLCNLLHEMDKGQLHPRLLSVVIAGLCDPSVNLKKTFSILSPPLEQKAKSMVSPSDNFGFPMLMSAENYQYPVLVEQMLFKTQKEKSDFVAKTWNFNEVFLRLFDIISRPIRNKIDELSSNPESDGNFTDVMTNKNIVYGKLINNCCHLISKVLSEIVYQTCTSDSEAYTTTANILHSTGSRFAKFDANKTWNTGNFGSDAIAFTVDRPGISIAGVSVYSGSGSYEYQLELLYDCSEFQTQSQHKWEVLSSVSGTYDQDIVKNDMAELKFDRPIAIKEFVRYAIRLCSQGARTSSGDCGYISLRGPCGVTFKFYPCDMSFNGTTISRGQIPAILYYSTPYLNDRTLNKNNRESYAKSVALQIATDIIKRCTELLINVRNALALCTLLSDKGSNSSNNLKTLDSEHNITPIEEHFDISWTNNGDEFNTNVPGSSSLSAKHITRRIENFSKGIMETFKLDRRITNPFEFEIDVGAKEISPNDVIVDDINNEKVKKAQASQINGNLKQSPKNKYDEKKGNAVIDAEINANQIVQNRVINLFSVEDTSLFHILLPQVFAYIGRLVVSDPKTSVDILNLIREILPHVSALNQIYYFNQDSEPGMSYQQQLREIQPELCTTSRYYCVVESDHPYKSATVSNYSVEFPSCVKWMTLEFDPQSGTGQIEDSLLISIPSEKAQEKSLAATIANNKKGERLSKEKSKAQVNNDNNLGIKRQPSDGYVTVKKLNSTHQWPSQAIILPGNRIEFSLQTASNYLKDNKSNRYGFKCLVIGYEDINQSKISKFCLAHLEHELAYLGGMCSATLMKNDNIYTDDVYDDYTDAEQVLQKHTELLSNGLFSTGGLETINNIFDSHLLVG